MHKEKWFHSNCMIYEQNETSWQEQEQQDVVVVVVVVVVVHFIDLIAHCLAA